MQPDWSKTAAPYKESGHGGGMMKKTRMRRGKDHQGAVYSARRTWCKGEHGSWSPQMRGPCCTAGPGAQDRRHTEKEKE